MAGKDIDITITVPARFVPTFNPAVLMKLLALRLTSFMTTRFENDGAVPEYGLPAWAPLRPSTISFRRKGSSKPLQDTGGLRASYLAQPKVNSNSVEVGSNKQYASFHEDGTQPYTIVPKTKKVLAAQGPGGWVVFGKIVHHPGLPARPVLPSLSIAERLALEEIESMFEAGP